MNDTKPVKKKGGATAKILTIAQYWPILPFVVLVAMFEMVPLVTMVTRSFTVEWGSGFTLENFVTVFTRPAYLTAISNTLELSLLSAAIGMVIVFILGGILMNAKKGLRRVYMSMLTLTSNFAGLPLAIAFMSVLGTAGVFVLIGQATGINWLGDFDLYTKGGLLMVYVYFQIPMGTLLMLPAFEAIRVEWRESAALLRASNFQFWWKVGIPVMMPSIAGTFTMLFANAVSAYATPNMLTDSMQLMSIAIANMFVGDLRPKTSLGSAFSLVMLAMILIMIGLSNLVKRAYTKGADKK